MMMRIFNAITQDMEINRQGKKSWTLDLVAKYKSMLDYVSERSIAVYRDNIRMSTQLQECERHRKDYLNLADRISRKSTDIDEESVKPQKDKTVMEEDFSVIFTPNKEDDDVQQLKKDVRSVCKESPALPIPRDVMTTRFGQVIMKVQNRKEAERLQGALQEAVELKDRVRVDVPLRRRERVLILSVEPDVEEETVLESVKRIVDTDVSDLGVGQGLLSKLGEGDLADSSRMLIENIISKKELDIRVVKRIDTRMGKVNWLLDVDRKTRECLLNRKRVCIEYERYRVVQHITMVRCFKCQVFGHMTGKCTGTQACAICSEDHQTKGCKSDTLKCSNCYSRDPSADHNHRADSADCPVFKEYRQSVMPKRL